MLRSNKSKSLWLNVGLLVPTLALLVSVLACDVTESDQSSTPIITDEFASNNSKEDIRDVQDKTIASPVSKEIFTVVENQPTPIGGMTKFYEAIQQNLKYPEEAKLNGIQGKVFVQFIVDQNGNLTDVEVVKGIGSGCDAEAIRVISKSLPWNPGSQRGINVNVRMIMPITFKLG